MNSTLLNSFIFRIALIGFLVLGTLSPAQSQSFSEDFSSSFFPTGWTRWDLDGNTAIHHYHVQWPPATGTRWTILSEAGNFQAVSVSWFDSPGQADDWMITPKIDLEANPVLEWRAKAAQAFPYNDGYEILISTDSIVIDDFTQNPPLFSTDGENTTFTSHTVDLSAYANQSVYIAFRNNSYYKHMLVIDDVEVYNVVQHDAQMTDASRMGGGYGLIPISQVRPFILEAEVHSQGEATLDSVQMKVNVYHSSLPNLAPEYTATSTVIDSLPSKTSATINFPGFTPTHEGIWLAEYIVSIASYQQDETPSNDTMYALFTITDSVLQRDDNIYRRKILEIDGSTSDVLLGNMYEIVTADTLTQIKTFLLNPSPGDIVQASIHEIGPNGIPDTAKIGVTETYILQSHQNSEVSLLLPIKDGPLVLNPGKYVMCIRQKADQISMGRSFNIYTPGTSWIWYANNPQGTTRNGWCNYEDLIEGSGNTFFIKAIFGSRPIDTTPIEEESYQASMTIFPNPSNGIIHLQANIEVASTHQIELLNMNGQRVFKETLSTGLEIRKELNVSHLPKGVYTLVWTHEKGRLSRRVVIR